MLQILDPGFLTTIQDLGRRDYQKFGVTRGGAMDTFALRAANRLLGNADDAACLEIAMGGVSFRAWSPLVLAVTGAARRHDGDRIVRVGEHSLPMNMAFFVRAGEVVTVGAEGGGAWVYVAVAGGIAVPRVLGSRATDVRGAFGGWQGRPLRAGDVLNLDQQFIQEGGMTRAMTRTGIHLPPAYTSYYADASPIRILWGPHDEYFTDAARHTFIHSTYSVTELSDRMGTRLKGTPVVREAGELLSCGVTRGAIQIPPDGQPIVLQADHQTTGGYPILATVIRADLARLAQKRAGEAVAFRAASLAEARAALQAMERILEQLPVNAKRSPAVA